VEETPIQASNSNLLAGKVFYIHQSSLGVSLSGVSISEGGSSLDSMKSPKFISAIEKMGGKVTDSLVDCTTVLVETQCDLFEEVVGCYHAIKTHLFSSRLNR
jgi:hypothetical protein